MVTCCHVAGNDLLLRRPANISAVAFNNRATTHMSQKLYSSALRATLFSLLLLVGCGEGHAPCVIKKVSTTKLNAGWLGGGEHIKTTTWVHRLDEPNPRFSERWVRDYWGEVGDTVYVPVAWLHAN